jgi:hypothetical protein
VRSSVGLCEIDHGWCAISHVTAQESHGTGTEAMARATRGMRTDVALTCRRPQSRSVGLERTSRDQMCILANSTL